MAILTKTNTEIKDDAQQQDDIDMAFESTMQRKLNSLVRTIVNEFTVIYASTGIIINTRQYLDELKTILNQTFRRVNREFSTTYLNDLEEESAKTDSDSEKAKLDGIIKLRKEIDFAILASLIAWSRTHVLMQSEFIISTWDKIIRKNLDNTIAVSLLNDDPIDNESIAKKTKKPLTDELTTHNETIAMQEVQAATENAKFTEVSELDRNLEKIPETIVLAILIDKTWITMGDSSVRADHAAANGQKKRITELFIVGGELLMHPKDSSHGASMRNIIRCRCKAIYL